MNAVEPEQGLDPAIGIGHGSGTASVLGPEAGRGPTGPLRAEIAATMRLAWPVVLAELGWVTMGLIDLVMVGRLGADAIGAVGLGNITFFAVMVFGLGLLVGLETVVSQSFGAGRIADCHRWLMQGGFIALTASVPLMLMVGAIVPSLPGWGVDPQIVEPASAYLTTLIWGTPPLLLYSALRRYLQAMNIVKAVTVTLVAANLLNFVGNWVLINGHWGFPRLGVVGSAWATNIARYCLFLVLLVVALLKSRGADGRLALLHTSCRPVLSLQRKLLALGLPAAIQFGLEVGVFGVAAVVAGRLGETALAAHEVVLHAASFTFMVPLGISSAGSVRVGQALGRRQPADAARAGWVAVGLGAAFMAIAGLTFILMPRSILALFTDEPDVTRVALPLLGAAAMFQLFDGLQVAAGGALRGAGDTRTPMYVNLAAHWTIGLPIGYVLAFPMGKGVIGLWIGLAAGLIAAGTFLLIFWSRAVGRLADVEVDPERVPVH